MVGLRRTESLAFVLHHWDIEVSSNWGKSNMSNAVAFVEEYNRTTLHTSRRAEDLSCKTFIIHLLAEHRPDRY